MPDNNDWQHDKSHKDDILSLCEAGNHQLASGEHPSPRSTPPPAPCFLLCSHALIGAWRLWTHFYSVPVRQELQRRRLASLPNASLVF